jgi:hypothetical protein
MTAFHLVEPGYRGIDSSLGYSPNPQRFHKPWVVIARAQVFSGNLKAGRDPRNPQFGEGGGPVEAAALGGARGSRELIVHRARHEADALTGPSWMLNCRALVAAGGATRAAS